MKFSILLLAMVLTFAAATTTTTYYSLCQYSGPRPNTYGFETCYRSHSYPGMNCPVQNWTYKGTYLGQPAANLCPSP